MRALCAVAAQARGVTEARHVVSTVPLAQQRVLAVSSHDGSSAFSLLRAARVLECQVEVGSCRRDISDPGVATLASRRVRHMPYASSNQCLASWHHDDVLRTVDVEPVFAHDRMVPKLTRYDVVVLR